MSGGGVRVSIPSNVRKTIQDLKEITGNHSDEEIYAMLKECCMDPNETAQKLLLQDPFQKVKRKRDRTKENLGNRESGDSRLKAVTYGRGNRGGWAPTSSRYTSQDAASSRTSDPGQDTTAIQAAEKAPLPTPSQEKSKEAIPAASSAAGNVLTGVSSGTGTATLSAQHSSVISSGGCASQTEMNSRPTTVEHPGNAEKAAAAVFGAGDTQGKSMPSPSNSSVSVTSASSSTAYHSSSDPVLVSSNESQLPGAVGAIKREAGGHRVVTESNAVTPADKSESEIGVSFSQGKIPCKTQAVGVNQSNNSTQPAPASSAGSRPSSNYSSRSQLAVGAPKVFNKEWKPKQINQNLPHTSGNSVSADVSNFSAEISSQSLPTSGVFDSEKESSKLQKKLDELHLPQRQHVIIPQHIQVPESERTKLSFGSFGASFGLTSNSNTASESEKSTTPRSETSKGVEEAVEEQVASNFNTVVTAEESVYSDHQQLPAHAPQHFPAESDGTVTLVPENNEAKQDYPLMSADHQYSEVPTSQSYNFGIVPPILGSRIAPTENSEPQAHDVSRLPGFVVQQPFDPASYYAQIYRSNADSDGRVSPFTLPGVSTKYNGSVAVFPSHSSPSLQEGGNTMVLQTTGPTPLMTQAAGLMQSSIPLTQQPVPVFRPPAGMHIPHYPPNFIPYGPYFSPFYIPPPGIHQLLGNGAFPQQPQSGNMYPAPPTVPVTGVKYTLPQYKPGNNTGNSTHMGMPSGFGQYGSNQPGYNPSSTTGGNTTANEDLGSSQFKENNVYINEPQSEGSAVWIATPGQDMSNLSASSFYNLPPQGQHVAFAPTQAGHGTFPGIYHPGQAVTAAAIHPLLQQSQTMGTVDMGGPAGSVYQQPQHQQINWPSNY